jgi:hypothetical protein
MTKDRLKEEIGWFKLLMTVALAMFTSIVGCLWSINQITILRIIILLFALLILLFIVVFLFSKIDSKIEELDSYE